MRVEGLDLLTTDMQKVQQMLVKGFNQLNERVGKIEEMLPRIIALIMKLGDKVSDFDKGKKLELNEVRYDEVSHTLTGIIREPKMECMAKKRKNS